MSIVVVAAQFGATAHPSTVAAERAAVRAAGCVAGEGCVEFGRVSFEHPTWGRVDLVLGVVGDTPNAECAFSIVDGQQSVRWEGGGPGCAYGAHVVGSAPDADGNLFVEYSTERYSGVTALRPAGDGMDDFGTLPYSGTSDGNSGRFGDSSVADVEGDGHYEIVSVLRPCDPDCATGTAYFQTFRWDGSDFAAELCTVSDWPTIPIQATPEPGGTLTGSVPPDTCGVSTTDTAGFVRGWIGVNFEGALGFAPAEAFVWPPTVPPPDLGPWASVSSTTPAPTTAAPTSNVVISQQLLDALPLAQGASGPAVTELQQLLMAGGYSVGPDGPDGRFGPDTAIGVAMLDESVFVSIAEDDLAVSGVMTIDKVGALRAAVASTARQVVSGPCPRVDQFVAEISKWTSGFQLGDLVCAAGWASAGMREYHWTDGSSLFFTVSDAGPVFVGSVYAENGCEEFDIDPEVWLALGCGPPPATPAPSPVTCGSYSYNLDYPIRLCDEGPAVSIIQSALWYLGADVDIDGYFGPGTEAAVRDFQATNGLEVDGLVGPRTWATLLNRDFALPESDAAFGWLELYFTSYDWNANGVVDPDELSLGD